MFGMRVRSNLSQDILQSNPMQTEGELDYLNMLNGNLPSTIRVLGWAPMPICSVSSKSRFNQQQINGENLEDQVSEQEAEPTIERIGQQVPDQTDKSCSIHTNWNARFSCSFRQYKYLFLANKSLNIEAMQQAANHLLGEHNFRFFCRMDENTKTAPKGTKNYQRIIEMVEIKRAFEDSSSPFQTFQFNIRGSGFLYNQIRCIMGVLYHVGLGREEPSIVKKMLGVAENPKYASIQKPPYEIASERVRNENCLKEIVKPLINELNEYESRSAIIKSVLQELTQNEAYGVDGN